LPDPFIDRTDLSNILGRDVTGDDAALAAVDAACDIVRDHAGQLFNEVSGDTATLDGSGTDALILPRFPVQAAGTVTVNGTAVTDYLHHRNGVLTRGTVDPSASAWEAGQATPPVWPKGRRNITVVYDHGYPAADLPRSVRMVALQVAQRLLAQGVAAQETVGDVSVRYWANATDLTPGERLLLRQHTGR
jgi:hypothetical protein